MSCHEFYGLLKKIEMKVLHNGGILHFIHVEPIHSSTKYMFYCNSYTYHRLAEAKFDDKYKNGVYITFTVSHGTGRIDTLTIRDEEEDA